MLSPKAKRNISRVVPFCVMWLIFSIIYAVMERGFLGELSRYPSTGNYYDFGRRIFTTPAAGLAIGLISGILEVVYFGKWFIKKSFTQKIVYKSLSYLLITFSLLTLTVVSNAINTIDAVSVKSIISAAWAFFTDYSLLGLLLYMVTVILVTQFYAEVSQSIGPGVISNFFLGTYHAPVEEERIFMFLDMKSSTTIAEKLGHEKYFEMLKDYFFDLSGPVVDFAGMIYQYAGDEMILTWKQSDGINDHNCLQCFFAMKKYMEQRAGDYERKFGLCPQFKAGLHTGKVTTGEIGSLKKEIIFTGDVLNTAARIQGLCNQYQTNILISDDLIRLLDLEDKYQVTLMGESLLKGKERRMKVFTVCPL